MAPRLQAGSAWSRILPIKDRDPLDAYGLPSKGETRLNDSKAQENYYAKIVERYVKFCADAGTSTELERQFSAMALSGDETASVQSSSAVEPSYKERPKDISKTGKLQKPHQSSKLTTTVVDADAATVVSTVPSPELQAILFAMRKLRESLTATHRNDIFAQQCYVFLVRTSILCRSPEAYQPALLHLLRNIHPFCPLPVAELREFVGYAILDRACRLHDYNGAYDIRRAYGYSDRNVDAVVRALVRDDFVSFWHTRRIVDGHQRAMLDPAVKDVRRLALKCLSRTYFIVEKEFLESCTGSGWDVLVADEGVGWELEGQGQAWVRIRRPKER